MNRSVLLLSSSAIALLAFGNVKPAHAQWAKGDAHYGEFPAQSLSDSYTTISISTNPRGTVTLNSACQNTDPNGPGYYTSGSYNNSVYQDYVWTGGPTQPRSGFFASTPVESSGSTNYYSGKASSSSGDTSGYTDSPFTMTYDSQDNGAGFGFMADPTSPNPDTTTTKKTVSYMLVLSTQADASSLVNVTATATAKVTFGDPGPG